MQRVQRPIQQLWTVMQIWISQRVATDVLPLLVHACSADYMNQAAKTDGGVCRSFSTGVVWNWNSHRPDLGLPDN